MRKLENIEEPGKKLTYYNELSALIIKSSTSPSPAEGTEVFAVSVAASEAVTIISSSRINLEFK